MTTIITQGTAALVEAGSMTSQTIAYGAIAILLLAMLLMAKEIVRSFDRAHRQNRTPAFDVAIVPLFLTFGLVVLVRFLRLMGLL